MSHLCKGTVAGPAARRGTVAGLAARRDDVLPPIP